VSEREETDGPGDAGGEPPFDVVQAVSDFVEAVIEEVDADPPDDPDAASAR
jgi:hypothetical protein